MDLFFYVGGVKTKQDMTKKERQLLLIDLCGRLPYGVKVLNTAEVKNEISMLDSIMTSRKYKENVFVGLTTIDDSIMTGIENIKPYLRTMSSMTEKEISHCNYLLLHMEDSLSYYDYLDSIHIDYRDLIPLGLALEAPDGMYR